MSRVNRLGLLVVLMGAFALAEPTPAAANESSGACAKCVPNTGCWDAELKCAQWNCGVPGGAVCGDLGDCNAQQGEMLVSCTLNPEPI